MPMKNSSTFFYVVKSFFNNSDNTEFYDEMNLSEMENTGFEPSENSIKMILDFAHAYDVMETETAGQIEMNYN
jgi:hypothetical protein